ncbi:hypothetical protein AABB24_019654, partial [Solanum stoloniferum]
STHLLISLFTKPKSNRAANKLLFKFTHISVNMNMIDDQRRGPPHAALLAVVVIAVMIVPSLIGENGEAITEFISELLTPIGLLLLPIILLLTIQFLSSDSASFVSSIFSSGEPNSIHRASGSPVGVALVLLLVLFLLYNPISFFGGDDED